MRAILLVICLAVAGPAEAQTKFSKRAIATPPEQIASKALVVDDPLDTRVRVETSPFFIERFLGMESDDEYMRAFIDRKTGSVTFQKVVLFEHMDDYWHRWNRVVAQGPTGPVELPMRSLGRNEECPGGICLKTESAGVTVPEELLRWVANGAQAGSGALWKMKLYGPSPEGTEWSILRTEVAGFLLAVDRERARVLAARPSERG